MDAAPFDRRSVPADATFSEWRAPDGWAHRRFDWAPPGGVAARGALLFAGGRGDFVEKYLEPLADWRGQGWTVTSFDWRGQGRSRGAIDANHGDFDRMVADFAALVEEWRGSTEGPHVLVGHSMGGHLLLRLLAEHRPDVRAAVLSAPMLQVNSGPLPEPMAAMVAAWTSAWGMGARPLWSAPLSPAPFGSKRQRVLTNCPDRYADELHWWETEPGYVPVVPSFGWLDAAYRSARAFAPAALAKVKTPVLILATARDELVSAAAIRRAARLLPHAELAWFDEAAHELLREREPLRAQIMARIDAFLDEQAR